jgi:hypothetical protein
LIVYPDASFDINPTHPRAKGSDIEARHGSVLTAASFDPLAGRLRHFLAIIAHRETPLISAGNVTGYLCCR